MAMGLPEVSYTTDPTQRMLEFSVKEKDHLPGKLFPFHTQRGITQWPQNLASHANVASGTCKCFQDDS